MTVNQRVLGSSPREGAFKKPVLRLAFFFTKKTIHTTSLQIQKTVYKNPTAKHQSRFNQPVTLILRSLVTKTS